MATPLTPFAELPFRIAAEQWVELKRPFTRSRTQKDAAESIKRLNAYFSEIPLDKITIDHLREYQRKRLANSKGACINRELATLRGMLREADLWEGKLKNKYKPVPLPHFTPGRALSPEELANLFAVARRKKRWQVAFYASVLSANTAAGPGEIRNLQVGDIDLENRAIQIRRGVKNRFRVRRLDLNDDALCAVTWLLERARRKGSHLPEHYLLAHRAANGHKSFDPTRPQGHWYSAWRKIRSEAGLPTLRIYDLRHTALTSLYENPHIPERAIIDIAGWSSGQMASRYAHIRPGHKRNALLGLSTGVLNITSTTCMATAPLPSQRNARIEPKPITPAATSTMDLILGFNGKGRN